MESDVLRISVVIPTCTAYADCWGGFARLFRLFWPDCRWPLALLCDGALPENPKPEGFDRIHGRTPPIGWCGTLTDRLGVLERDEDLVLMMQEDFFLTAPVVGEAMLDAAKLMESDQTIVCVRIAPCPPPARSGRVAEIGGRWPVGEVCPGEPYRISCQAALWRIGYLRRVASAAGTTAADFEIGGTRAAETMPGRILSVCAQPSPPPIEYLCSGVTRGRWNPDAIRILRRYGIEPDLARGIDGEP